MKSEFKSRPESKRHRVSGRPTSRYINPEQAKTTFEQGKKEQGEGAFQKAIELYIRATIYDPNFFQAYCNMGTCYRSLKQFNEAKKAYYKAITIKKEDAITHYNLANLLRLLGDYQSSIDHYCLVIDLREKSNRDIGDIYLNSLINLGICYKSKQLYENACECYDKVLKIDPKDETSLFNYAMTIVSNLQHIDQTKFHEVTKEKAEKAVGIFKKYQEINKNNPMVDFQILSLSVFLDDSSENINKVMEQLNALLKSPNCTLTEFINIELGRCLKLLKQYEKSAQQFQKSFNNLQRRKSSQKQVNKYDSRDAVIVPEDIPKGKITQEEGIKLIEDGNIKEVQEKIQTLEDTDITKHVLQFALELNQVQESGKSLKKAEKIYDSYFRALKAQGMDKLSIESHKLVGMLLSLQKNFKESIKHYEYVNAKLTSEDQKSKIYNNIGNQYEALGDLNKAVEQYKIALKSQPNSYEAHYNVGCCCYQQNQFDQALEYFQKFIDLLQADYEIKSQTKKLYRADCLIMTAACRSQLQINKVNLYQIYLKAWNAIKQVIDESENKLEFEDKKILSFYLEWAEILEEKLATLPTKNEEQLKCKEMLLQTYLGLLENEQCPDKEAILTNCAIIYNEEKQYANGLANFMQIDNADRIPANNMALTYLHLHEHYMATKFIFKAASDTFDVVEHKNKEIICWIYSLEEEESQQLSSKFKNKSDEAMICRLEYGIMIIDAVTTKINQENSNTAQYELDKIKQIYNEIIESDSLLQWYDKTEHPKLKAITQTLKEQLTKTPDHVDPNLLENLLCPSKKVEEDFAALAKRCSESGREMSQAVVEVLLNLFVFINRKHVPSIRTALSKLTQQHRETMSLQLDRKVTVTPDLLTRTFGEEYLVRRVQNLVAHLVNWQSQLETKTTTLFKCIERTYYKSKFRRPLEYQYNFPRHAEWDEDNATLLKIAKVVLKMIPTHGLSIWGKNISEMKSSIFNQLQKALRQKAEKKQPMKLTIGEQISVMTVYGFFQTKADCLQFVKELQKDSSLKKNIDVGRECQELVVDVSGIIRLVCQWAETNPVVSILNTIWEHQLPMEAQAVISLQGDLILVTESSEKAKQLVSKVPELKK